MAWSVGIVEVGVGLTGTVSVFGPAVAASTIQLQGSGLVFIGQDVTQANYPLAPGQTVTLSLAIGDEVYARTVARPGHGQRTPVTASVYRAVTVP